MGLSVNLYEYGMKGINVWCTGVITPFVLLFMLFTFRMIGAGDVKLLAVVGGFIGSILVLQSIFIAFILGAIMSILKLVKYNNFSCRFKYLAEYLLRTITTKKIAPYYDLNKDGYQSVIPFTVAIMGAVFIIILKEFLSVYFI